MSDDKIIGQRVRCFREKAKMTQEKLAEEVGVTSETISKIERGKRSFSLLVCCLLSETLGCTPNDLLGYTESNDLLLGELKDLVKKYSK